MKTIRLILLAILILLPMSLFSSPSLAAWEVNVQISIPDPAADSGMAANNLVLGVNNEATDNFDSQWDVVALSSNTLDAHFLHPEYPQETARLWKDLRGDPTSKQWEVEVSSPLNGQVEMTWNRGNLPGNVALRLIDSQTGNFLDMTQAGTFSFRNAPNATRKLTIQTSEKSVNSSSASSGGGGCGYIKSKGKDGRSSINPGSAALNLIILFTPLIWLAIRRTVFFDGVVLYGNLPCGEIRNEQEKAYLLSWFSILSVAYIHVGRLRRRRFR